MSSGRQCNAVMYFTACVLRRHLYVDLQLRVLIIYWTVRMNTDRPKYYSR